MSEQKVHYLSFCRSQNPAVNKNVSRTDRSVALRGHLLSGQLSRAGRIN
jgi:hypothetical protein